jgi:hypothetical protein
VLIQHGGQLVAERFAAPGRQNGEYILSSQRASQDLQLAWEQRVKVKELLRCLLNMRAFLRRDRDLIE